MAVELHGRHGTAAIVICVHTTYIMRRGFCEFAALAEYAAASFTSALFLMIPFDSVRQPASQPARLPLSCLIE